MCDENYYMTVIFTTCDTMWYISTPYIFFTVFFINPPENLAYNEDLLKLIGLCIPKILKHGPKWSETAMDRYFHGPKLRYP